MDCPSYCIEFSTCKDDQEARDTEKRLKACWDNISDIKLDKRWNCYFKYVRGIPQHYNLGICPRCGDVYIDRIEEFPPVYKELEDLCRECEERGE